MTRYVLLQELYLRREYIQSCSESIKEWALLSSNHSIAAQQQRTNVLYIIGSRQQS